MIATVLILAFTIAIGGIISVFMTNLTKTTTGEAEKTAAGTAECAGAYINIINVTTGAASVQNILVHNPSKNTIYITSAYDDLGNVNSSTAFQKQLASGGITALNGTSVPGLTAKKISLIGFCENAAGTANVSISGTCPKGGSCWPK